MTSMEDNRICAYFLKLGLTEEQAERLAGFFTVVSYGQGQTMLAMGEKKDFLCLILTGVVRGYYLDEDGNDVTKCFSRENDWCCFYNYVSREPSPFYVEALEEVCVAQIRIPDLEKCLQEMPSLQECFQRLVNEAFLRIEEKNMAFARLDAKERYLKFLREYPDLAGRVRQEHIATYLGITPSSLSRIKRSL